MNDLTSLYAANLFIDSLLVTLCTDSPSYIGVQTPQKILSSEPSPDDILLASSIITVFRPNKLHEYLAQMPRVLENFMRANNRFFWEGLFVRNTPPAVKRLDCKGRIGNLLAYIFDAQEDSIPLNQLVVGWSLYLELYNYNFFGVDKTLARRLKRRNFCAPSYSYDNGASVTAATSLEHYPSAASNFFSQDNVMCFPASTQPLNNRVQCSMLNDTQMSIGLYARSVRTPAQSALAIEAINI